MRFHVGPVPGDESFDPTVGGWRPLKGPSFSMLMVISVPVAVAVAAAILMTWSAVAARHGITEGAEIALTPTEALIALGSLGALIVVHELLHALTLPGFGMTPATIMGFWASTVTPYVTYTDELSCNRYVLVGLTPFMLLSMLPLLLGLCFGWVPGLAVALSIINGFLSSGDLVNAALLLVQTPWSATVRNKGLDTWWRTAGV